MNKFKSIISVLLCLAVLVLTACNGESSSSELKIAVSGLEGNYNPFYARADADRAVVDQMYRSIQYLDKHNNYVNYSGGITYEFVGDSQIKYTVSIADNLYFSDGTNITIDDVIFFYHFIADASYDGYYSDWYLNDIAGLKEFYFDDADYQSSIEDIEYKISLNYTPDAIETDDFAAYLEDTMLDGSFDGNLSSESPSGKTWRERLEKLGYSQAISDLGDNPTQEEIVELVALAEAEHNPKLYDPEKYYREKLLDEYIEKSYSDDSKVDFISGIKKVNDYTCTVLYNSRNINAIGQLNALLVSKKHFAAEYIKGSADKVKAVDVEESASGPYVIDAYDDKSVQMKVNEYFEEPCDFSRLRFIDCDEGEDMAKLINSGKADIAQFDATQDNINALNQENTKYYITDNSFYTTLYLNSKSLDLSARRALAGLCDVSGALDSGIGSYYTKLLRPLSVRYDEYPSEITEPYYTKNAFTVYTMGNTEKITEVTLYYCGEEGDLLHTVLTSYKDILSNNGISLKLVAADEAQLRNAIASGKADMWAENVYDGDSCDKYEYYNSLGKLNYTGVDNADIDTLTLSIRQGAGFSNREKTVSQLMELIMDQAVECPLYQLQTVTAYNTDTINPDSLEQLKNFDGYTYCIPMLKRN